MQCNKIKDTCNTITPEICKTKGATMKPVAFISKDGRYCSDSCLENMWIDTAKSLAMQFAGVNLVPGSCGEFNYTECSNAGTCEAQGYEVSKWQMNEQEKICSPENTVPCSSMTMLDTEAGRKKCLDSVDSTTYKNCIVDVSPPQRYTCGVSSDGRAGLCKKFNPPNANWCDVSKVGKDSQAARCSERDGCSWNDKR